MSEHWTTWDRSTDITDDAAKQAGASGFDEILALTATPQSNSSFPDTSENHNSSFPSIEAIGEDVSSLNAVPALTETVTHQATVPPRKKKVRAKDKPPEIAIIRLELAGDEDFSAALANVAFFAQERVDSGNLDEGALMEAVCEEGERRGIKRVKTAKEFADAIRAVRKARHHSESPKPQPTTAKPEKAKPQKTSAGGVTFVVDQTGVKALDADGNATVVCSPLWIEAATRDECRGNWGRLLRFVDLDGNEKRWAMPQALLAGERATYEGYLREQGMLIHKPQLLYAYLQSSVDKRVLVVNRTGWHKKVFVFADECIGSDDGDEIFHQSPEGGNHLMQAAGTLEEWKANVARLCAGNSRLLLAVSAAFGATLLEKLQMESGGFQLRGGTSTGKTTALLVGGSVWGGGSDKGFLRRWRATINGLESVAASHNDALLCLDELAEVDPCQAGETAYMLANGQGKIRQTKSITLRKPLEWRTLFLSSGEISLADHLATAGKRVRGGMEVRLVDLPADAGQGLGAWENLHEFRSGKEFSDHLREASKTYYGTAAREFIRQLIQQPQEQLRAEWQAFKTHFHATYCPQDAKEEVGRVCDRFALLAFAGEMATEVGVTGWPENEVINAMVKLFNEWLAARGPGRSDEDAAIRQVRLFLEQHSDSRFRRLVSNDERTIINQAGYVEHDDDGEIVIWYILPEVFRAEICKGYDVKHVAKTLHTRGWLRATHDLRCEKRTPEGKKKMYAITGNFME